MSASDSKTPPQNILWPTLRAAIFREERVGRGRSSMQSSLITGESFGAEIPVSGVFVWPLAPLCPSRQLQFHLSYHLVSAPTGGVVLDSLENAIELHVEGGDFYGSGQLPSIHYGVALVNGRLASRTDSVSHPRIRPGDHRCFTCPMKNLIK